MLTIQHVIRVACMAAIAACLGGHASHAAAAVEGKTTPFLVDTARNPTAAEKAQTFPFTVRLGWSHGLGKPRQPLMLDIDVPMYPKHAMFGHKIGSGAAQTGVCIVATLLGPRATDRHLLRLLIERKEMAVHTFYLDPTSGSGSILIPTITDVTYDLSVMMPTKGKPVKILLESNKEDKPDTNDFVEIQAD